MSRELDEQYAQLKKQLTDLLSVIDTISWENVGRDDRSLLGWVRSEASRFVSDDIGKNDLRRSYALSSALWRAFRGLSFDFLNFKAPGITPLPLETLLKNAMKTSDYIIDLILNPRDKPPVNEESDLITMAKAVISSAVFLGGGLGIAGAIYAIKKNPRFVGGIAEEVKQKICCNQPQQEEDIELGRNIELVEDGAEEETDEAGVIVSPDEADLATSVPSFRR